MTIPTLEPFETRRLLSASLPTNDEQLLLELINRARANPTAEATRFGIALNEGLPAGTISTAAKQPLAFNTFLVNAARGHTSDMLTNNFFAHNGSNGSTPQDRMAASGYAFSGQSFGSGENIAYRASTTVLNMDTTTAQLHQDLFVDSGVAGRGHRTNLLNPSFKEVGTGVLSGPFTSSGQTFNAVMATEDFAYNLPSEFLTGVAYTDAVVHDHFYTPGEGLGGVTIKAKRISDSAVFSTKTFSSGGYTLALDPGTYTVTASGKGFARTITFGNVVIGSLNVKRDFIPDNTPPTAKVRTAPGVAKAGGKLYTFTVTYSDNLAMNSASISSKNIVVTGPHGFKQNAALTHISVGGGGATIVATYTIVPPGGAWDKTDDGTYSITLRSSQVSDLAGLFVAGGKLGTFAVTV